MQSTNVNLEREDHLKITETNLSIMMEFVLLGFTDIPQFQWFLFGIFLVIYVIILLGNGIIILITRVDTTLQRPMYFSLGNFSFLEICYVSVTLPRMLMDLWTQRGTISFFTCAAQMCFSLILEPLSAPSWPWGPMTAAWPSVTPCTIPWSWPQGVRQPGGCLLDRRCSGTDGPNMPDFHSAFLWLQHNQSFLLWHSPLFKRACGDIFVNEMVVYVFGMLVVTLPFLLILGFYIRIISTILKLPANTGRTKAFSTCSSHISTVLLFYGSATVTYLKPKSNEHEGLDKLISLFYTILTPMFNPIIYSLRNKDVRKAMRKFLP